MKYMNKRYIFVFLLVFGLVVVSYVHYQFNNNRETVDILIVKGTVITMDSNRTILEAGTVVIKDGAIVAVGASESLKSKFKAKETINANGRIVMPGLINTHTHAAMVIFRGFADDLPTQEWLENYIWPAEAKYINAETVRLGTLLAIAEMIRSGTTTFNDMYFFEDEVANAAKEAGIRAVVGEGLLDFPTPNKKTPQEGLEYTEMLIQKWRDDPLITVAVAPHAPYTCSPEILKAAKNLSDKYNVRFHIHLSETEKEVNELDDQIGSIEEGKRADIIVIGLNKPHTIPIYNPYSHIVYVIDGADVETVIIDGKIVMLNQKILTINEGEIIRDIRAIK